MIRTSYVSSLRHAGQESSTRKSPRMFRSLGLEPLPGILGHRNPFALETFHQFDLQALLFQALQVLPDEAPDVVARRAVVGREAALFDELLEVFRKRDGHGAGVA